MAIATTAAGAAPPDPGLRIPHERAIASFSKLTAGDCAPQTRTLEALFVVLYEPRYQELAPGGRPSDVAPWFYAVYSYENLCQGTRFEWYGETGLEVDQYTFERLKSASLGPITLTLSSPGSVDRELTLELSWVGDGHPSPVAAQSPDARSGEFEVGVIEEATVAGTATVKRTQRPMETLFAPDGSTFGEIGHFNRVSPPAPVPGRTCVPAPPGMTAWWPGDEDARDIVGGFDGHLIGDAATDSGLVGGAFALDGDGDFVDVPDDAALDVGASDFSVALWVLFNDTNGQQVLVEKWIQRWPDSEGDSASEGWTLTKLESNQLLLATSSVDTYEDAVISAVLPILSGNWVHFAATRQGGKITLFMNGKQVAEGTSSHNLSSASTFKLGHRGNASDTPGAGSEYWQEYYLNGRIDEVQYFVGSALTPKQIGQIYQAGTAGVCKP